MLTPRNYVRITNLTTNPVGVTFPLHGCQPMEERLPDNRRRRILNRCGAFLVKNYLQSSVFALFSRQRLMNFTVCDPCLAIYTPGVHILQSIVALVSDTFSWSIICEPSENMYSSPPSASRPPTVTSVIAGDGHAVRCPDVAELSATASMPEYPDTLMSMSAYLPEPSTDIARIVAVPLPFPIALTVPCWSAVTRSSPNLRQYVAATAL